MNAEIRCSFLGCALLLVAATAGAQQITTTTVSARAILHTDGTRTESVKDVIKREMKDTTYDERGVVIATKIFLLNDNGDPVQGVIRDGADNLIARVQFYFDDLGRVIEERCVNTQNEIFRRVIHKYDLAGRALPVNSFDYAVNAPSMKAGKINFTNIVPPPDQRGNAAPVQSQQPQQPGQAPRIQTVSPRSSTTKPADPKAHSPFGGKK